MANRTASQERKTNETQIGVSVDLDGSGTVSVETGIGFFDHMLNQLGTHSRMNLTITAKGDTHIDDHHTVEDVGILLGNVLKEALGDRAGIQRFGTAGVPLDESLCRVDLDISGRGGFFMHGEWPKEKAGTFDSYLAGEFLNSFAKNAEITLHLQIVCGDNAHHIVESAFKSVAAALRKAIARDASIDGVPSTKGVL